ncbi:MAG: phosphoribosyl 1,2-cyclic phosphodiesterase [Verrucomicrobiales bacterium]|jgi:phosphoribosyl 1,2-cyclic phosphodiesterase
MKLHFWGTRGSIPKSNSAVDARLKVKKGLIAARGHDLSTDEALEQFLDQLPFSIVGNYGGNTTCYEIQEASAPNEYILFDAGSGLRSFGADYMAKGKGGEQSTFHIFFSHLHWDHIQGFPFFIPAYIPGNRVILHGHHPALPDVLKYQMEAPFFPVPLSIMGADIEYDIQPPGTPFSVAGFNITTLRQHHPGVSFGYRFEKDGKAIVLSTDSEHKDNYHDENYPFVEFCRDADIVVFDAQYMHADATGAKEDWGHSSNLIGVELCARAKAKTLCMVHHEPTADDEELEDLENGTRRYCEIHGAEEPDPYPKQIYMAYDTLSIQI